MEPFKARNLKVLVPFTTAILKGQNTYLKQC